MAALATGLAAELDAAIADGNTATTNRMTSLAAVQQRPDALARALSRSRETWPMQLVVTIDDYHQISGSEAAEAFVGELVTLLPATFVITTRTRPAWCTSRQALYGEAIEVGTAELTMTEPEARQVFEASPGRSPRASTYEIAHGWPVVIGLVARTGRDNFPSKALPRGLYKFLADELIQATDRETQRALTVLAICGTTDRALARELIGPTADAALTEAEKRGLLTVDESTRLVLHPLLAAFLIAKLNERSRTAVGEVVRPLIDALVRGRRWDECLSVAEALPEACDFASGILDSSLQELLSSGRVATIRRWVELAQRVKLTDPIVELAEAEIALLAGKYDRAIAVGTHAAGTTTSCDLRSRAELVVGRAAHLADHREVAKRAFESAEASAASPEVRAAALWGQLLVQNEEERPELEDALSRFAAASDGTGGHAVRLAHGRMLVELSKGDARRALDCAQEAAALMRLSADPLANLAAFNQLASMLAYVARYQEALHVADRFLAAVEDSGSDFALSHGLLSKARALIGLRRFADARHALRRVVAHVQLELDPWIGTYVLISQARLEISLGDLDRARDYLKQKPAGRASTGVNAEYDAHLALIEAASGNRAEAMCWIKRSRRSTSIDARSLAWLAATILAFDSASDRGPGSLRGVDKAVRERISRRVRHRLSSAAGTR